MKTIYQMIEILKTLRKDLALFGEINAYNRLAETYYWSIYDYKYALENLRDQINVELETLSEEGIGYK